MRRKYVAVAGAFVLLVLLIPRGASLYYESTRGAGCARCHEIAPNYDAWRGSAHRSVRCEQCHESSQVTNLKRVAAHISRGVPEQIRLKPADLQTMVARCGSCHQQEFADWKTGPHGATYAKIFLDEKHNRRTLLMDDCLRCHGAHFEGGIRDVVTPIDRTGPWKMRKAAQASLPAIPCLFCHEMHREGKPLAKPEPGAQAAGEEIYRPSLAVFDRRGMNHVPLMKLQLPYMLEGTRPVKISPDQRQALCYQCHAPVPTRQVNSGDDKTPVGVHEGISCLGCHQKHGQRTRASCSSCHPRLSNCGLDVEKMDTSFLAKTSKHDIHSVKCIDCHTTGIPRKKQLAAMVPGR
jgi:hypothetical protein